MANNAKINIYRQIALTFVASSVILILVILYVSLSRASIIIQPEIKETSVEFMATIKDDGEVGSIPGKVLQTSMKGSKDFTASSKKIDGDGIAKGEVTLYNKTQSPMTLIATTRLLSKDNVLFRLQNREVIPANGKKEVAVYADKPGADFDIGPTSFVIPGLIESLGETYRTLVYAESDKWMAGGAKLAYEVTKEDIDKSLSLLKEELTEKALMSLKDDFKEGENLLDEATHVEIISQNVNAKVGEKRMKFNIEMEVQIQGLVAQKQQILKLAKEKLALFDLGENGSGYLLLETDSDSLEYSLEKYDQVENSAQLKIFVKGKSVLRKNSRLLDKNIFVGMKKDEVYEYFEKTPELKEGVKTVEVEFAPFWVWCVPKLTDHIDIKIKH